MKKYIIIKADINDGDYITKKSKITDEQIEIIRPLTEAIKHFIPYETKVPGKSTWTHSHNWSSGELTRIDLGEKPAYQYYQEQGISEEVLETFNDFVPQGEYGIHTIKSIDILVVQDEIKLL